MKKFGLIGYPLGHSFSEKFFTDKFEKENLKAHTYQLFPLQNLSDLPALLKDEKELCGLNVTIPHKIGVMFYLDEIDPVAKEVDAVNCIKVTHQHPVKSLFSGELCLSQNQIKLKGFNTDVYGFEQSLKPLLENQHKKALILGNGGAARAVKFVLEKLKIDYKFVSRRPKGNNVLGYNELTEDLINDHKIIINSSPVGTFPNVEEAPLINYDWIGNKHLLYDLIYNPAETAFLRKGKEKGAKIKNGYEMLELQALKSWEIWNS